MEVDRRTLVKGMAAGGALLALGSPPFATADSGRLREGRCALLLGLPDVDAAFERGARSVVARVGCDAFEIVRSASAPMLDPGSLIAWMERSRGTRWIAILDDASAAIFQELVRMLDARLLARGSHACSRNGPTVLRNEWLAATPAWSAGALLASRLIEQGSSFSIQESFVSTSPPASPALEDDDRSGRSDDWVECVGQAVAASAFGFGAGREIGADRAFVLRARERRLSPQRFATFIVDL